MQEKLNQESEEVVHQRCEKLIKQIISRRKLRLQTNWLSVICLALGLSLAMISDIGLLAVLTICPAVLTVVFVVMSFRLDRTADRCDAETLVACEWSGKGRSAHLIGTHGFQSRFFANLMARAEKERREKVAKTSPADSG